jgi:hypothetical protein
MNIINIGGSTPGVNLARGGPLSKGKTFDICK